MCQYSCEDGFINDWHLVHLGSTAIGCTGLVMVEATGVEARGRISPGCSGIWKDKQIEPMARIVKFLKSQDSVPAIQLANAGRKASTVPPWVGRNSIADEEGGWPTIGPSAIAFGDKITKVPKEATLKDIEGITNAFVSAAKRSVKAGFDVIELHFVHGYLVNTFLFSITNKRNDKYGGSLENRMRLGLEISKSIRKSIPQNIVLGVRVSVTDYVDKGWDVSQTVEFAKELKKLGIDFLDCSSGGLVSGVKYKVNNTSAIQISAAGKVQKEVGIATAAVGKIVNPNFAEKILKDGKATLIMIGRGFLNNPHWTYHAADVLGTEKANKISQSVRMGYWTTFFRKMEEKCAKR